MLQEMAFRIQGTTTLILHNGHLADVTNLHAKAIKRLSGKRKKTDEDYAEMGRIEWLGSLYFRDNDETKEIVVPGYVFEGMLKSGGKHHKLKNSVVGGVFCSEDLVLDYEGPKNAGKLWEGRKHFRRDVVRVGTARVIRTRPQFFPWGLSGRLLYDSDLIDREDLKKVLESAGQLGLCEWRPRFGRFEVIEPAA